MTTEALPEEAVTDANDLVCACGRNAKPKADHPSIRRLKREAGNSEVLAYIEELEALWAYAKRQGNVWRGIAAAMGYEPNAHKAVEPTSDWLCNRVANYRAMRAATQPTAMPDTRETVWLVECPKYHPGEYFALCDCGCGRHHWTPDVHKATKFASKEEAETTRGGDVNCIAVEHEFGLKLPTALPEEEVMRRAREACAKAEGAADLTPSYLSGKYDLTIAVRAVALALRSLHIPLKPKVNEDAEWLRNLASYRSRSADDILDQIDRDRLERIAARLEDGK